MRQSLRVSALFFALLMATALAIPLAAAGGAESRIEPAKLVVNVYYQTDTGRAPLAGVEVFSLIDGTPRYRCTNVNGKAVFKDLGFSATLTVLATGPSVNAPRCSNQLFLNPDNGKPMYTVFFKNHQGVRITDTVVLGAGRTSLKLIAKTPNTARRVCAGFKVTIQGTTGIDGLIGTPGDDVINGRGGNDLIDGRGGADVLCGGPGADVISGGTQDDFLWGGGGKDSLAGDDGTDWVDGGARGDVCTGETLFNCEA